MRVTTDEADFSGELAFLAHVISAIDVWGFLDLRRIEIDLGKRSGPRARRGGVARGRRTAQRPHPPTPPPAQKKGRREP